MNPPIPRKPGSPGPVSSPTPEEDSVAFSSMVGAVIVGALISGIAINFGAALTETSGSSEFDIFPVIYFMGAAMFSLPVSTVGITVWQVITGRNHAGLYSVPYFFVPMAALIYGLFLPGLR